MPPSRAFSRAVLIGCGRYEILDSLSGVENGTRELDAMVRDREVWGLPPSHVACVIDPASMASIVEPLNGASRDATDTLLFYFSGHGAVGRGGELRLAIPTSRPGADYSFLGFDEIRHTFLGSAAKRKIVILDTCYSGRALGRMSAPIEALASQAEIDGTYMLAAASENSEAIAPPGAPYTAFTGELLDVLRSGLPDVDGDIELDSLYHELRLRLAAKGLPAPQQRVRNGMADFALFRNRRTAGPAPAEQPVHLGRTAPVSPSSLSREKVRPFSFPERPFKSVLSRAGSHLAVCCNNIKFLLVPLDPDQTVVEMRHHAKNFVSRMWSAVNDVDFNGAGDRILSCGDDGTARVWDLSGNELLRVIAGERTIYSGSFSGDGELFATAAPTGLRVWDSATGGLLKKIDKPSGPASFAPGRPKTLAFSNGQGFSIWDLAEDSRSDFPVSHGYPFMIDFLRDGSRVAVAHTNPDRLSIWRTDEGTATFEISHPGLIRGLAYHPSGRFVVTTDVRARTMFWDADTGANIHTVGQNTAPPDQFEFPYKVTFSWDGRTMVLADSLWRFGTS